MQIHFVSVVRMCSEICATATLLFLASLGVIISQKSSVPLLQSSILIGASYTGVLHCFTASSGAHANPCITIACWLMGQMRLKTAAMYIAAQIIGAFIGFYLINDLLGDQLKSSLSQTGLCAVVPAKDLTTAKVYLFEYFLTAILIMGCCSTWSMRNSRYMDSVPLRMGFLMTALCLAGGNLTGANMNPVITGVSGYLTGKTEHVSGYIASQLAATITVPIMWRTVIYPITSQELC